MALVGDGERSAVGDDRDRAVAVGPEDLYPTLGESLHDRWVRVAVDVSAPGGDDRHTGPDVVEEKLRRRALAPVVPELEHVGRDVHFALNHVLLCRRLRVAS